MPESKKKSSWKETIDKIGPYIHEIADGKRIQSALSFVEEGIIVSTSHKFNNETPTVLSADGVESNAQLIGFDNTYDVAFFTMKGAKAMPKDLIQDLEKKDNWGAISIGEEIRSISRHHGNLELAGGIIQYIRDRQELPSYGILEPSLGIDGNLPYGFTGGALIHESGKVLGLNSSWPRGTGMTLPFHILSKVYEKVKSGESRRKRKIGVQPVMVPIATSSGDDESIRHGILISQVAENSPAEKAGMLPGDILLKAGDQELDQLKILFAIIQTGESDTIDFTVLRGMEQLVLKVSF